MIKLTLRMAQPFISNRGAVATISGARFGFARNVRSSGGGSTDQGEKREEKREYSPMKSQPAAASQKYVQAKAFEVFDPKKSKYGLVREEQVQETIKKRVDAPDYLKNEQKFKDLTDKVYQVENPVEVKERMLLLEESKREKEQKHKRMKIEDQKKNKQLQISDRDPIAKKVAMIEHQRQLQTFDRFNEDFVTAYMAEREYKNIKKMNQEAAQAGSIDQFINVSNVESFNKPERVSKRLSRMGICSRRIAEKLIEQGMIKVDGKTINENTSVTNENLLQVSAKTGVYTPVKENTRIWLFHKPMNMVTTHSDPQGRVTVFQRLKDLGLDIPHVISVGRLDYLSEGLLILTNDGDLARTLELPLYRLERVIIIPLMLKPIVLPCESLRKNVQ